MKYVLRINIDEEFEYLTSFDCNSFRYSKNISEAFLFETKNEFYKLFTSVYRAKEWLDNLAALITKEQALNESLIQEIIV